MSAFIPNNSSRLDSAYTTSAAQDVTMMAWFMLPNGTPGNFRSVCTVECGFLVDGITICTFTDGQTIDFRTTNLFSANNTGPLLSFGVWYHVAMSVRNTAGASHYINGYLNGNRVVTATDTITTFGAATSLTVGNSQKSGNIHPLNGNVRDFRMWNRVLNDEEVKIEFSSGVPVRRQALAIWSPFDDDLFTDRSGNGNIFSTAGAGTISLQVGPSKKAYIQRGLGLGLIK